MPVPIAVFTYNRPHHTKQMLASLAACDRLNECKVFIFCDGAKKEEHRADVAETRNIVRIWAIQQNAEVIERDENYGLSRSIISGITALCKSYGRVIVIEDDLLLATSFIDYQLQALEYYANDERVYQVVGFMFPTEKNPPPGIGLMPITSTWGWGTWARAWEKLETNVDKALDYLTAQHEYQFDLNGTYPYTKMMRQHRERSNSWGVMFWYTVWRNQGLCLFSRQSLVANIGMDGSGVNSGTVNPEVNKAFTGALGTIPKPLQFPNEMDKAMWARYQRFIAAQNPIINITLWQKLLARLR